MLQLLDRAAIATATFHIMVLSPVLVVEDLRHHEQVETDELYTIREVKERYVLGWPVETELPVARAPEKRAGCGTKVCDMMYIS